MKTTFKTPELVRAALFVALGIVLPMGFHMLHMGGPVFLPMHIPVLIAGFFLSPVLALIVGILTPLLSSLLTGMPPLFPMAVIMIPELAAYGFVVSFLSAKKLGNSPIFSQILALLFAMLAGRMVAGLVVFALSLTVTGFPMSALPFVIGAVTTGLPGILIQLIFIPALLLLLSKARIYHQS